METNWPIVKVEWYDACSYEDLYEVDHEFSVSPVVSVGKLFSTSEKQVILVRDDYTEDDGSHRVSGVLCIPTQMIKGVIYLEDTGGN